MLSADLCTPDAEERGAMCICMALRTKTRRSFHFNMSYGKIDAFQAALDNIWRRRISFYHNNGDESVLFVLQMAFYHTGSVPVLVEHNFIAW